MINRARVRPSRGVSAFGVAVGIIFTCVGLFFVIPRISSSNGPIWFGILWTLGALGITIFHGINVFTDRGIAVEEIQFESKTPAATASERLAEIQELKDKGVISQSEYDQKRAEIISKI